MAPRSSIWDHKSDKDLLLTIIEMGNLKNILWPDIAQRMQAKGYSFSKEACRQHFQKIRKEARGDREGIQSAGRSPAKSTKTSSEKSTPQKAGMSQKGSFASGYGYDAEDDDEEEMSQSTKRKRTIKLEADKNHGFGGQSAPLFKIEDLTGNVAPIDLVNDDLYYANSPRYT